MVDPFSFATGLAGLVSLTDLVATKGFKYARAVKNCSEEVRQLMVELDLFGGVVRRLARLVEEEEKQSDSDPDGELESDYVYECQVILKQIKDILVSFEQKSKQPLKNQRRSVASLLPAQPNGNSTIDHNSTPRTNPFQRLSLEELRWPLSKGKTVELRDKLERQKSACMLAISADSISKVREILGGQALTNNKLAEIREEQRKIYQMSIIEKLEESDRRMLEWFSPIDPEGDHQRARGLYQKGTGRWFVDSPEFESWLSTPNSTLWMHGIPGAGKTILASLVIEETFDRKTLGTAYYYCTYRNEASQRPAHILGSLIRQLAVQNLNALELCRTFHSHHHPSTRPSSLPTEAELGKLLQDVSKNFEEVSLIIDGLDECGWAAGIDRLELTRVLADLHQPSAGSIRVLIASRREQNIEHYLAKFDRVSIAAMSSDLELYVAAEVARRLGTKILDESLRNEIIESLVNGAEGMFQWVKCQVDYLFKLPNNSERRKALKELPPDLPATYVRIFERICRDYSVQTQRYVQRVLQWVVYDDWAPISKQSLTLERLASAIAVDVKSGCFNPREIPNTDDIREWCGSLIEIHPQTGRVTPSHFTVKEFIQSSPTEINSTDAQKFLLEYEAAILYQASACLVYISNPHLPSALDFEHVEEFAEFNLRFPFYELAAFVLDYLLGLPDLQKVGIPWAERVFTPSSNARYVFWRQFTMFDFSDDPLQEDRFRQYLWPLHYAAYKGNHCICERLLLGQADVNAESGQGASPIDLAVAMGSHDSWFVEVYATPYDLFFRSSEDCEAIANLVELLCHYGSCLDHTTTFSIQGDPEWTTEMDPLTFAMVTGQDRTCEILLKYGAKIDEDVFLKAVTDVRQLGWIVDEALEVAANKIPAYAHDSELQCKLQALLLKNSLPFEDCNSPEGSILTDSHGENSAEVSEELFAVIKYQNEVAFNEILLKKPDLESRDERGQTALYHAAMVKNNMFVSTLISLGADKHSATVDGDTPLLLARRTWGLYDMREAFGIETGSLGLTPKESCQWIQHLCGGNSGCTDDEDTDDEDTDDEDMDDEDRGDNEEKNYIEAPENVEAKFLSQETLAHLRHHIKEAAFSRDIGQLSFPEALSLIQFAVNQQAEDLVLSIVQNSQQIRSKATERTHLTIHEPIQSQFIFRVLGDHGFLDKDIVYRSVLRACQDDHTDFLKFVFDNNLVECIDTFWEYLPSHILIRNPQVLQTLLDREMPASKTHELLSDACEVLALPAVERLLSSGVSPNFVSQDGSRPITKACRREGLEIMEILVRHGAELSGTDRWGKTCLHCAAHCGEVEVGRWICKMSCDGSLRALVDQEGKSALHAAVISGVLDMVKELVSYGFDINAKDSVGLTPLALATLIGKLDVVQYLIAAGVDFNAQDKNGWCPLTIAMEQGDLEISHCLIDIGADVNIRGSMGWTPFTIVLRTSNLALLEMLIQAGADLNARDDIGWSPLCVATMNRQTVLLTHFLYHGADVNLRGLEGCTALHIAARLHLLDVSGELIDYGADVCAQNDDGETPLQFAEQGGPLPAALRILLGGRKSNTRLPEPQLPQQQQLPYRGKKADSSNEEQ